MKWYKIRDYGNHHLSISDTDLKRITQTSYYKEGKGITSSARLMIIKGIYCWLYSNEIEVKCGGSSGTDSPDAIYEELVGKGKEEVYKNEELKSEI